MDSPTASLAAQLDPHRGASPHLQRMATGELRLVAALKRAHSEEQAAATADAGEACADSPSRRSRSPLRRRKSSSLRLRSRSPSRGDALTPALEHLPVHAGHFCYLRCMLVPDGVC